ncbi:MAG: iron-sulfur cluster assembly protein [Alphaproteobacteria bacterium]
MMKIDPIADQEMVKQAVGEEAYDELSEPPGVDMPRDHTLWPKILKALREIYDPEIPVNIYELGLIYKVAVAEEKDGKFDVDVKMTLTSPGCPVAQEMPVWVQSAILPIEGVGDVDVEIIWEPTWDPSRMAETAKMQLNMFY